MLWVDLLATGAKTQTQRCAMRWGIAGALLLAHALAAQTPVSGAQGAVTVADKCAALVPDIPHSDTLRDVCEYALALPARMPNITCEQTATRYLGDQPADVVTAIVTYENGKESYRDIKSNGMQVSSSALLTSGPWSTGQFGGDVQSLFQSGNKISFQFVNEREVEGRQVLTFQYRVPHQDVPVWRLHMMDQVLAPPFHGQLRVDTKSGTLLRLLIAASEIPSSYPMRTADVEIKYEDVSFSDGTSFVLPTESVINGSDRKGRQNRNELEFSGCHKFRATARIVPQQ